MKVLVVDDEPVITDPIRTVLQMEGYQVCVRATAAACLVAVRTWRPDLILLDIMMPGGMTGLDALRIIRQETDLPVILITARSEDAYKVLGLEYADDYLVKPFTMPEMLSRIRAVMRRVHPRPAREATIEAGDLRIDLDARLVTLAGRVISLTPKEFDILLTLASRPNRVFTHEELAERAWGPNEYVSPRTLAVHVGAVRRKLGGGAGRPSPILTVRGVGFRFVA
jgi:two-component system response regulator MtrA